jgi:hypothetical protein
MRSWAEIVVAPACRRWCAGALVSGIALLVLAAPAAASPAVPYDDPAAHGYIGLCDEQGHQINSGSVDAAPFAWRAVSTAPALGPYAGSTRTAVLMAYQPIEGLAPADWSGDQLTASSRYSNPANPMAAATGGDESLAGFMTEYTPKWDGILQLRLYLDAANQAVYSLHYPALDIRITGKTWHTLDGGQVDCHAGTAVSIESLLLPASKLKSPPGTSASATTAGGSSAGAAGGRSAATAPATSAAANAGAGAAPRTTASNGDAPRTQSSDHTAEWAGVAALLAAALVIALFLARSKTRRTLADGAPSVSDPSDPILGAHADRVPVTSEKGSTP